MADDILSVLLCKGRLGMGAKSKTFTLTTITSWCMLIIHHVVVFKSLSCRHEAAAVNCQLRNKQPGSCQLTK